MITMPPPPPTLPSPPCNIQTDWRKAWHQWKNQPVLSHRKNNTFLMTPIKSTRSAHFDVSCTCMLLDLNVKAPSAHEKEPYLKKLLSLCEWDKKLTHNFYRKQVNYSPSVQNSRHIRNVSQKSLGTNKENKLTRSSLVRRGVFHQKENVTLEYGMTRRPCVISKEPLDTMKFWLNVFIKCYSYHPLEK